MGIEEAEVDIGGLLVAALTGGKLSLEAALLVEGVIKLGVGVSKLHPADEELEALDEARVFAPLSKRRDFHRISMDEGRLDEGSFDELIEEGLYDVAGAVPALPERDFVLLGKLHRFLKGDVLAEIDAGLLEDGFGHRDRTEGLREIDHVAIPVEFLFADHLIRDLMEEAFGPFGHIAEVGISLIEFDGGEFRIMAVIDAFVTENASDFVNAVDAANHAFLEVKLGGDAKIEIAIESVMVGDEWTGGGTTRNGAKNRGLDLHEALGVTIGADTTDDRGTGKSDSSRVIVDDEVNIAFSATVLKVGKTMEFLRKRLQALGDVGVFGDADREFSRAGDHERPLKADDVAKVRKFEDLVIILADNV